MTRITMKNICKRLTSGLAVIMSAAILLTALATVSQAQVIGDRPWTTIGSAGTADEGSEFNFTGGTAFLNGNSGVIRYNVVAVDGLFASAPLGQFAYPKMTVRFRDSNSNDKRVRVFLRRAPLAGGNTVNLLTLDSNDYAPSVDFQTQSVRAGCGENFSFDFVNYTYFIEVEMTNAGVVAPAVAAIQLGKVADVCIASPGD